MGTRSFNDIVNELSLKRKFNEINDGNSKYKCAKAIQTEYLADKLVKIYNAPKSRNFFLKCAWNLSEDTIWSAVEDSRKKCVRNKIGLFIFLCDKALKERPIKN